MSSYLLILTQFILCFIYQRSKFDVPRIFSRSKVISHIFKRTKLLCSQNTQVIHNDMQFNAYFIQFHIYDNKIFLVVLLNTII